MFSVTSDENTVDEDLHHYDFTTASPWEVFIAHIEEILYQWELTSVKLTPLPNENTFHELKWKVKCEEILFADTKFILSWHSSEPPESDNAEATHTPSSSETKVAQDDNNHLLLPSCATDMMHSDHDFVSLAMVPADFHQDGSSSIGFDGEDRTEPHVLARWYGLRQFVVLVPVKGPISSESKIKTLLSSFNIALNNTKCEVPIFVRILEPWQRLYYGVSVSLATRVDFEMIQLCRIPSHCKYITGISSLFKSKVVSDGSKIIDQIVAAVRLSYQLKNWTSFSWKQDPPNIDPSQPDDLSQLLVLPVGSIYEPLSDLMLSAVWPEVLDNVVIDNESYSDFDPFDAPLWTLSVTKLTDIVSLLSDYLLEFLQFCRFDGTAEDLLGEIVTKESSSEFSESLSSLTDSKLESRIPKLSGLLFSHSKGSSEEPIPKQILLPILYYLFPDTEKSQRYPYIVKENSSSSSQFKSCDEGSLVWRLGIMIVHALHMFGGAKAAAHLWHEFSQELRYRWNSGAIIPGVADGSPDPKTCLLHQKLQMLNCCILKRIEMEKALINHSVSDDSDDYDDEDEEEDDEFYDCDSDILPSAGNASSDDAVRLREITPKRSLWDRPCGRLERHTTLRLLSTNQPLYVPRTQGSIPKTEDQIDEDAEALMRLGVDAEASLLRAKLMSASLLSDMESFKAANPGAIMEDFIRWYSPRDWIEKDEIDESTGQPKGELSPRMLLPGNTWVEVWSAAKPVPARRQKRLFDETKEAERALHFIESMLPAEAGRILLPVVSHATAQRLNSECSRIAIPNLNKMVERFAKKAETRSRMHNRISDVSLYQDMIQEVAAIETVISQVKSLECKLQEQCRDFELIANLIMSPEAKFSPKSYPAIASRLIAMFTEQHRVEQMLDIDEPLPSYTGANFSQSEEDQAGSSGNLSRRASRRESGNRLIRSGLSTPTSKEVVFRCYSKPKYRSNKEEPIENGLPQRMSACVVTNVDITIAGAFTKETAIF